MILSTLIRTKLNGNNFLAIVAVLLLLALPFSGMAQQASAKIAIEKNEIKIGEQLKLHLEITLPTTEEINFPILLDTITKHIEVIDRSAIDTIYPKEDITVKILSQDFIISSFDTGFHAIPPITFTLAQQTIQTNPLLLTVKSIDVDQANEIKGIKDPLDVSFSFLEWFLEHWKVIIGIYALIGLALVAYKLLRKKKIKEEEVEVVPDLPAHEIALEEIKLLKAKKLWQSGFVKAYHSEISEILRSYIERRFEVNAMEQTTDEIFGNLKYVDLQESSKNKLRQILMLSDMVKFAKTQAVAKENELSIDNAMAFVLETKMTVEPTVEKEEKTNSVS